MARGNDKRDIFADDSDRHSFLERLDRVARRLQWRLWAYCLMPNHYHLLIETVQPTLSRGMRDLNGAYSQAVNRRHQRVGHVFQGRFRAVFVDRDTYLLEVCRYIVCNPVKAGLCDHPQAWRWSSYRATVGLDCGIPAVAATELIRIFDPDPSAGRRAYSRFVGRGDEADDPASATTRELFLGDAGFVAQRTNGAESPSTEVPRIQRAWKSLEDIAREHPNRNQAIRAAYADGQHTLRSIAEHFDLHYATVSRIARQSEMWQYKT
jgi:REP element-mobilizing transposase RayT